MLDFSWNAACLRASRWPALDPMVVLHAFAGAPVPADTGWTDGSFGGAGAGDAAAIQPSTLSSLTCRLSVASSSTQCELVALSLVAKLRPPPSLMLTDSLVSLQLIQSWGRRPIAEVIACPDRQEVRCFMYQWLAIPNPPCLGKVKAHDLDAIRPLCLWK